MYWGNFHRRPYPSSATAAAAASRAESKATSVSEQIDRLEDRVDGLSLICQAMWELLSEAVPDADARLTEKVTEIDFRDGARDGKLRRVQKDCPNCHRRLHQRHLHCLYCGQTLVAENIFQK